MSAEETCKNPLYLEWVKEMLDVAREHNTKGVTTYKNAYNALKACPIQFTHPCQLQQLKGFGPKICDRLTEKLKKHCEQNGLPMPNKRKPTIAGPNNNVDDDEEEQAVDRPVKKARKAKPYVPAMRSGGYALLLGLAEADAPAGLNKAQLIEIAQPHCDASLSVPVDSHSHYTAWNSMKTLLDRELVCERGRPLRKYFLTDEGWEVAKRIQQTNNPDSAAVSAPLPERRESAAAQTSTLERAESSRMTAATRSPSVEVESQPQQPQSEYANVVSDGAGASNSSAILNFRPIRIKPGTFSVELVLDVREIRAKTDRDYMQEELTKKGAKPIMRSLELGDALWVAKCHDPNFLSRAGAEGDEVVLDYIVERKRLDDLIGSVKDGRFHEQKFRLKRSGVQNVIYIVEETALDPLNKDKYEEMVQSAIASTQVVNGYFLKKTQKMDDTIRYLTRMTMLLKKLYEDKPLLVIPTEHLTVQNYLPLRAHLREKEPSAGYYISYPAFASLASKSETMTLRDVYLKMLMCTKQVTGEKAIEIQKRWKTPYDFVKAFEDCGADDTATKRKRELVFGQMGNLYGRKKIAKALSHKIAEVWGDA